MESGSSSVATTPPAELWEAQGPASGLYRTKDDPAAGFGCLARVVGTWAGARTPGACPLHAIRPTGPAHPFGPQGPGAASPERASVRLVRLTRRAKIDSSRWRQGVHWNAIRWGRTSTRKFLGAKPSLGNPWEGVVFAYGSARSDAAILAAFAEPRELESNIMAKLTVDGNHLVVLLSALEKIARCGGT
jgi:hypothetical protein